jgi:hypothetical protein
MLPAHKEDSHIYPIVSVFGSNHVAEERSEAENIAHENQLILEWEARACGAMGSFLLCGCAGGDFSIRPTDSFASMTAFWKRQSAPLARSFT